MINPFGSFQTDLKSDAWRVPPICFRRKCSFLTLQCANICTVYLKIFTVPGFLDCKISGRVPRKSSGWFSLHDCSQHSRLGHVKLLPRHVERVAWVHFLPKRSSLEQKFLNMFKTNRFVLMVAFVTLDLGFGRLTPNAGCLNISL